MKYIKKDHSSELALPDLAHSSVNLANLFEVSVYILEVRARVSVSAIYPEGPGSLKTCGVFKKG